ncbi:MAG: hypothetical protein UW34_C0010G0016 [Parcubacteria group bacterium GW2011_GWA2_44_15]|nr:MAG: hypothetical protein UW34_C0010G0016 [Parcubacteria group bacterium GW2011_GWA2_44_15]
MLDTSKLRDGMEVIANRRLTLPFAEDAPVLPGTKAVIQNLRSSGGQVSFEVRGRFLLPGRTGSGKDDFCGFTFCGAKLVEYFDHI